MAHRYKMKKEEGVKPGALFGVVIAWSMFARFEGQRAGQLHQRPGWPLVPMGTRGTGDVALVRVHLVDRVQVGEEIRKGKKPPKILID